MEVYQNKNGNSGITHYEIGVEYIAIRFENQSEIYIYTNVQTGKRHIDKMKKLAISGKGLSTYISQHPSVKNNFLKQSFTIQ